MSSELLYYFLGLMTLPTLFLAGILVLVPILMFSKKRKE